MLIFFTSIFCISIVYRRANFFSWWNIKLFKKFPNLHLKWDHSLLCCVMLSFFMCILYIHNKAFLMYLCFIFRKLRPKGYDLFIYIYVKYPYYNQICIIHNLFCHIFVYSIIKICCMVWSLFSLKSGFYYMRVELKV